MVIFEPTAQTANLWPTANRRPAAGWSLVRWILQESATNEHLLSFSQAAREISWNQTQSFCSHKSVLEWFCPTEYIAQNRKQLRAFDEVVPRRLYLAPNFIPICVCQLLQLVIKRSVFYISNIGCASANYRGFNDSTVYESVETLHWQAPILKYHFVHENNMFLWLAGSRRCYWCLASLRQLSKSNYNVQKTVLASAL